MSYLKLIACAFVVVSASGMAFSAPALFTGSYAENFDELGPNGTAIPTGFVSMGMAGGNSTFTAASPVTTAAIAGAVNGTQTLTVWNPPTAVRLQDTCFNAGSIVNTSSDRALGTNPTSDAASVIELVLQNNTGASLTSVTVAYDMKVLANGNVGTEAGELPGYAVFYSLTGSTVAADWTSVPGLYLTNTTVGDVAHASAVINFGSALPAGSSLYLRWADDNNIPNSPDQTFAIDNVSVTPEPATMTLLALGALGLLRRRK